MKELLSTLIITLVILSFGSILLRPPTSAGTADASGRNWCLLFNDVDYGLNDSVTIPYSKMFDMHQLTIEVWVKPRYDIIGNESTNSSERGTLIGHCPQFSNTGWWTGFLYSTGNLCLQLGNSTLGSCVQFVTRRDTWDNDSWYNVAVTFNPRALVPTYAR